MTKLETLQQERGSVGIAYWMNIWTTYRKKIQMLARHPTMIMLLNAVSKSA